MSLTSPGNYLATGRKSKAEYIKELSQVLIEKLEKMSWRELSSNHEILRIKIRNIL